ncbi:MAG: GNAT family N-acetyltransferase [Clostridium sp.]
MRIETERLFMIPISYEFVCDKISGKETELERNGIRFNNNYWQESELAEILPIFKGQLKGKNIDGFSPWLIVLKGDNRVIGNCGCHGEPDDNNEVEIGYEIDADCRKRGYAKEAVKALVDWLIRDKQVSNVSAECGIDNIASIKLLKYIEMLEIDRDSEFIYWKLFR